MRLVIQRVTQAAVSINGGEHAAIGPGMLILVGITTHDTPQLAKAMAAKIAKLRIFSDENGKMNRAINAVNGSILVISQFTLYGDVSKSNRPSFTTAAHPSIAEPLYNLLVAELVQHGLAVATGIFAADMQVSLINDGPVTLILEK